VVGEKEAPETVVPLGDVLPPGAKVIIGGKFVETVQEARAAAGEPEAPTSAVQEPSEAPGPVPAAVQGTTADCTAAPEEGDDEERKAIKALEEDFG
jgi:hypothetical protein